MNELSLKGSAYILYKFILDNQPVRMSLNDLAGQTGYCYKSVQTASRALRLFGLVRVERDKAIEPFTYHAVQK